MIRDIRPTDDPEVVVARGLLYDHDKVIEAGLRILTELSGGIRDQYGLERLRVKLSDGGHATSLNAHVRGLIAERCREEKASRDVCIFSVLVTIPPFALRFYPYGSEKLNRCADGLVTSDGHEAESLSTVPELIIAPSVASDTSLLMSLEPLMRDLETECGPGLLPFPQKRNRADAETSSEDRGWSLTDGELGFLKLRIKPLLAEGLSYTQRGSVITLRFDAEKFLIGERDLRIECTDL